MKSFGSKKKTKLHKWLKVQLHVFITDLYVGCEGFQIK